MGQGQALDPATGLVGVDPCVIQGAGIGVAEEELELVADLPEVGSRRVGEVLRVVDAESPPF